MLTRDSPVHRAKISGDGQYAAVGSESDDGAVFLFSKDSNKPVWKFPMPERSSARALNFTSDGAYIGAATFKGDAYIFDRNSSIPVSHWKVNTSLGGIDIAEDGSFIAAGGTDSNLHIFKRGSAEPFNISFNEYVEEIDISANGKYIAAGTGGSVYFFEASDDNTQAVVCKEIKEPPVESINRKSGNAKTNGYPNINTQKTLWPGMLFGFGFIASFLVLVFYVVVFKFDLISKIKIKIFKKSANITGISTSPTKGTLNKKIIIIASIGVIFLLLTAVSVIINSASEKSSSPNQENSNTKKEQQQNAGCGNGICEPDLGETKTNCPNDCSGGN